MSSVIGSILSLNTIIQSAKSMHHKFFSVGEVNERIIAILSVNICVFQSTQTLQNWIDHVGF